MDQEQPRGAGRTDLAGGGSPSTGGAGIAGTSAELVIDASVVGRWLLLDSRQAREALARGPLVAPAVIVAETANAIVMAVRFGGLDGAEATSTIQEFLGLPVELVPDRALAVDAVAVAAEFGLTAYDASYIVLAERRRAPLITADRRLAQSYAHSELIA